MCLRSVLAGASDHVILKIRFLYRSRHLLLDILQLLPHSKKDAKLDTKSDRGVINEVADLKNCSSTLFFETRKHQDLYLWAAKTPNGPSIKFHVTNGEWCTLVNNVIKWYLSHVTNVFCSSHHG